MAGVMKTYIIEETATYYIVATDKRHAERKFLNAISFKPAGPRHCEVPEREVYPDPENRLIKKRMRP